MNDVTGINKKYTIILNILHINNNSLPLANFLLLNCENPFLLFL